MISANNQPEEQSLLTHLTALRAALIRCTIVIFITVLAAFALAEPLYAFLQKPIATLLAANGLKIIVISPLEQAFTYFKLAFFCGIIFSLPYLLGEIWHFVAPGLKITEKKFFFPIITLGTLLFFCGLACCYYFVLPLAMEAIIGWLPKDIEAAISMERYFSVVIQLMVGFGIVFETPLITAILIVSGLVPAKKLASLRKYYIILAFIVGALLTPADPFSQIAMALPLILFFELGLILGRILKKNESKEQTDPAAE